MDFILVAIGFICCVVGIFGSFLPVLPGPILSWFGLLLLHCTQFVKMNYWILGVTFILTIVVQILDYIIPAKGVKKFGGSKYGLWGTNIGLILGLFFPPFGFIIGLFLGAFIGELITDSKDKKRALKAAFGAFLGFLTSAFMQMILCICITTLFIYKVITNM